MKIVSVEGNIGSGKSSVLEVLRARGHAVHQEPLDHWGELLDLYYADPVAWSLPFNLKVLHGFYSAKAGVRGDTVFERSPGACRHVFGQLSYNDNHLSPAAWGVFKEYHDLLGWTPDAYVYIDTPPSVCYERIQRRGRACETGLTEDYLRRIEFQYQNFLKFAGAPVIRVDGAQPTAVIATALEQALGDVPSVATQDLPPAAL